MGSLQAAQTISFSEKESFNPNPNWELALPPILLTETHKSPLPDTALLCPLICVCFQPADFPVSLQGDVIDITFGWLPVLCNKSAR